MPGLLANGFGLLATANPSEAPPLRSLGLHRGCALFLPLRDREGAMPVNDDPELPVTLSGLRPPTLAAMAAEVQTNLAVLPENAHGAVFTYAAIEDGTIVGKIGVVAKISDGWTFVAEADAERKPGDEWKYGAKAILRGTW